MRFASIALAGGAGSLCRYLLWRTLTPSDSVFPIGTLAVNLLGCFVIGILAATVQNEALRLALITGFLGGFTTFSAFGMESVVLLRNGFYLPAVLYIVASNAGGILLAWAGWRLGGTLS